MSEILITFTNILTNNFVYRVRNLPPMSSLNEQQVIPQRHFWHPVLIATAIFLAVGLTAGDAVWLWKANQGPVVLTENEKQSIEHRVEEAKYQPGEKSFVLSERELNGLLNLHTTLGEEVKIELEKGAVHARVKTTLDQDFPVLGGKTVRAKARFLIETQENPSIILDDLTLYGVSLPNAWLAELKGKNLLAHLDTGLGDNAFSKGIENINIERGLTEIQLTE